MPDYPITVTTTGTADTLLGQAVTRAQINVERPLAAREWLAAEIRLLVVQLVEGELDHQRRDAPDTVRGDLDGEVTI